MKHILVAEDDNQGRYLLEIVLRGFGFEVESAANGKDALDLARKRTPDLIVSDILMPVMDGFSFCREVRLDESLRETPFVFYTATYTEEEDERFALSLGANRFIRKPADPEVFVREIEAVLTGLREGVAEPDEPRELASADQFLELHDTLVTKKLEKKIDQLREANEALERELVARKRLEDELKNLNANLERRVVERTRQLQNANRELEAFAHSVSHDLRAPLRAIDGYADVLRSSLEGQLNETSLGFFKGIQQGVSRMSALIESLLSLSRAGRQGLRPSRIDMTKLVQSVLDEDPAVQANEKAKITLEPLTPAIADETLLRQVWSNLIGNAVKFSRDIARPEITVGSREETGTAVYFVRDNGVGFDPGQSGRLFKAFQRLHPALEFEGTGIGLALCSRIIERHGGRIWAEASPNEGATFSFTLGDVELGNES